MKSLLSRQLLYQGIRDDPGVPGEIHKPAEGNVFKCYNGFFPWTLSGYAIDYGGFFCLIQAKREKGKAYRNEAKRGRMNLSCPGGFWSILQETYLRTEMSILCLRINSQKARRFLSAARAAWVIFPRLASNRPWTNFRSNCSTAFALAVLKLS
jgi:succinate-acetate transporter protein